VPLGGGHKIGKLIGSKKITEKKKKQPGGVSDQKKRRPFSWVQGEKRPKKRTNPCQKTNLTKDRFGVGGGGSGNLGGNLAAARKGAP